MERRPIFVLGAEGQVGSALMQLLGDKGIGFSRAQADLTQADAIIALIQQHNPEAVINAAAYTAVDKAESEPELARIINATTPGKIAEYCSAQGIIFIHYSTDYVFSGKGDRPWKEDDATAPLNTYGKTKREGEELIERTGGNYLIFRTSWVYDGFRKNFLTTMLNLGKDREALKVVNDQFGAPTYAPHLAEATLEALENAKESSPFPSGIYHLCGGGITNWHEFACEIFAKAKENYISLKINQLAGISSTEYPTPAARPPNSRMDCSRAFALLGVQLPSWQEGLTACFKALYEKDSLLKKSVLSWWG
ncbi:MAG: dTDP-4-dehydrorhamnose reductase subunit,NAD(P)-binding, of dTDP-L-rhamnose synthase [Rickettsiales bacterium]|jgi:dTDP-4-dehydrorhamnose reductase|nr:dTDP-4-dehydrorhamnose reductase subunit,NAD(P)-binding, of dTDP-L-rhamnose synthase [Rickettsiales bacterium]